MANEQKNKDIFTGRPNLDAIFNKNRAIDHTQKLNSEITDMINRLYNEQLEAEKRAKEEAERRAREEAERLAREEAERLAREEAERLAREEAERLAREEAERLAREEAERLAREEAERLAREEAERLAREEAERRAREEAERLAREEAERLAREEAERYQREEAERRAREEAAWQERLAAERQAEEIARQEAEIQAMLAAQLASQFEEEQVKTAEPEPAPEAESVQTEQVIEETTEQPAEETVNKPLEDTNTNSNLFDTTEHVFGQVEDTVINENKENDNNTTDSVIVEQGEDGQFLVEQQHLPAVNYPQRNQTQIKQQIRQQYTKMQQNQSQDEFLNNFWDPYTNQDLNPEEKNVSKKKRFVDFICSLFIHEKNIITKPDSNSQRFVKSHHYLLSFFEIFMFALLHAGYLTIAFNGYYKTVFKPFGYHKDNIMMYFILLAFMLILDILFINIAFVISKLFKYPIKYSNMINFTALKSSIMIPFISIAMIVMCFNKSIGILIYLISLMFGGYYIANAFPRHSKEDYNKRSIMLFIIFIVQIIIMYFGFLECINIYQPGAVTLL
ncbi:MAG: hypothetical protein K6G26_07590 [Lachnospiraceae bacterium]|nr:hypothetical protein [Lachnospiraceae bacterium]